MRTRKDLTIILSVLVAITLIGSAGCSSSDDPTVTPDTGPGLEGGPGVEGGPEPDTGPAGNASISFTPTWGKNQGTQFPALWRPSLPYYEGDSAVVVMLCKPDDPTCLAPVLVREVDADARGKDPIQGSFGPEITVGGLPAGSYKLMIFADGVTSRALGYGWDSGFATREKAWGGKVSEGDMMLSAETPGTGDNPEPSPVDVTLADGATEALDKITLAHVHERDISPVIPTDTGTMLVAVETGLRLIDLTTTTVTEVAAGTGVYTHQLVDDKNKPLDGVCGVVRGPGTLVYLLYTSGKAYGFDTATRKQLSTHPVTFADAAGGTPCRGLHVSAGGKEFLYVVNATANPTGPVGEGLWFADVTDLGSAPATAARLKKQDDPVLTDGFGALVAHEGSLYLTQLAPANATTVPEGCAGAICVYRAALGADGTPDLTPANAGADYDVTVLNAPKANLVTAQGTINCITSGDVNAAGLGLATFQGSGPLKDHDLLFVGGCLEVSVLDLDDGRKAVDFNAGLAGAQGLDATVFGQNFASFQLAPDGETLWSVPSYKAPIHFDILVKSPGDPKHRQTFNRQMALPISLTSADLPGIDPDFAKGDIDDFEGPLSLGEYSAPADDPGVDLNHAHAVVYQMTWAPSTAGSTFQSASISVGPTFAITPKALWLRGSGTSGVSGLGKGGNLGVYDLASRQALLWSRQGHDFYRYWQSGPSGDEELRFGFDLTPEGKGALATLGLLYLP